MSSVPAVSSRILVDRLLPIPKRRRLTLIGTSGRAGEGRRQAGDGNPGEARPLGKHCVAGRGGAEAQPHGQAVRAARASGRPAASQAGCWGAARRIPDGWGCLAVPSWCLLVCCCLGAAWRFTDGITWLMDVARLGAPCMEKRKDIVGEPAYQSPQTTRFMIQDPVVVDIPRSTILGQIIAKIGGAIRMEGVANLDGGRRVAWLTVELPCGARGLPEVEAFQSIPCMTDFEAWENVSELELQHVGLALFE
ncbi:hypothetical protein U9M48_003112 [Paspalum notatum var. saurae]|uniref:Uncharacterized protein n=1 Tax=Paspalum notatum var. saurae TaxID=547442 RepID=A0AAQ3PIN0_PASNO